MQTKRPMYVVGCCENPRSDIFPTHHRPIVVEEQNGLFRRLFCYHGQRIIWAALPNSDFVEHQTILRFSDFVKIEPMPFKPNDQTIFLGGSQVFVGSKLTVVMKVIPWCFGHRRKFAWQTILNALSSD